MKFFLERGRKETYLQEIHKTKESIIEKSRDTLLNTKILYWFWMSLLMKVRGKPYIPRQNEEVRIAEVWKALSREVQLRKHLR